MGRFRGFIGPTYTLRSVNADAQRCINLYPELNEMRTEKEGETGYLVKTPGLTTALTLPSSPTRGGYLASTGAFYAVGGNKLYLVSSSNTATEIGTLSTSVGLVSMADNGTQIMIVDGQYGYIYNISTATFAQITDPDFPGADIVQFQDGYFIFNIPNSGRFGITELYDGTNVDGLDFATAEGAPDNIISLISAFREVWLFGDRSIEVFYNSGASSFPFQRIQGAFIEHGCAAKNSVLKLDNHIYWLGKDDKGQGIVYTNNGYQPVRISNHAVETAIQSYSSLADATAWSYQEDGHTFYCLNFTAGNATWVYDVTTQIWHERGYWNKSTGAYERQKQEWHCFAYGYHYVGDYSSGKIFIQSSDYFDDAGDEIRWLRQSPHISSSLKMLKHTKLQLDMETGVGLSSGQGSDPLVSLQWSDDGGHSWSNEYFGSIGKIGETKARVIWRRLGRARDRVYRVFGSDPVKIAILGAEIDVSEGTS